MNTTKTGKTRGRKPQKYNICLRCENPFERWRTQSGSRTLAQYCDQCRYPEKGLRSRKIIESLQQNPSLSLTDVSRQERLSRERVRQIADDIPGASRHREKYCLSCGVRIHVKPDKHAYRQGFCFNCWLVEEAKRRKEHWEASHTKFICEICGREFYRPNSEVRWSQSRIRFCGKKCQGVWLGRNYGIGQNPLCPDCGQRKCRVMSYICDCCESIA